MFGSRKADQMKKAYLDAFEKSLPPAPVDEDGQIAAGLAAIKDHDPDFDQATFLQRATTAFIVIQKVNEDRNLIPAAEYLSPELYDSWATQMEQWKGMVPDDKLVRRVATGTTITQASHDEDFDHITVHMSGMTTVYPRDKKTGELSPAPSVAINFSEYWSFTRSAGARTPPKSGVTQLSCPYCGAPLTLNEIGQCDHCKTGLRSDSFDWVVSHLDQTNRSPTGF